MGTKRKKQKAMVMNLEKKTMIWDAKIIGELPKPEIKIFIDRSFGWASGELRWCSVVTKDGEIGAKYPHETEREAKLDILRLLYAAEKDGVDYCCEVQFGDTPKRRSR